jgi:putative DNA primase/helicase
MRRAELALNFISPVERGVWVSMGMSLKSEFGDDARDMWMEWSRQADSFREADANAVWKSFKGVGISLGSLFHEAKAAGWKDDDKHVRPTPAQLHARQQAADERLTQQGREREAAQQQAANKAGWIMHQTIVEKHAYFDAHGMPDVEGLVWWPNEKQNLLCIPMRVGRDIVGLQMIDRHGEKKFLSGQRTSGAEYLIDNKGMDIWVEGYCTGLAVRICMAALKMRYRVHVTFSANNLKAMATSGFVIADNDTSKVGEKVAIATGLPYWISDVEGEDFCEFWQRLGTFRASQELRKYLAEVKWQSAKGRESRGASNHIIVLEEQQHG